MFAVHVLAETRTGRNQAADNDVFLQAAEVVLLAQQCGFRKHLGGFLEACRRDEGIRGQGGLGDAQNQTVPPTAGS